MERKCHICAGSMRGVRENYHYTECGLNSVYLKNILVFHCGCGAVVPEIPQMTTLHRAIVLDVLKKGTLLSGEEIRFLRKMARLSGVDLARVMGVHPVTVSKWENNNSNIGPSNDRVLRLICFTGMLQQILEQKDEKLLGTLAAAAKKVSSLNIKMFLEKIEERSEGPKTVTIDPALLSGFGRPEDEAVVSPTSVLQ